MIYLEHCRKSVGELVRSTVTQSDHDYEQLSEITTSKPVPLLKYHVKSILKHEKRPKWSKE